MPGWLNLSFEDADPYGRPGEADGWTHDETSTRPAAGYVVGFDTQPVPEPILAAWEDFEQLWPDNEDDVWEFLTAYLTAALYLVRVSPDVYEPDEPFEGRWRVAVPPFTEGNEADVFVLGAVAQAQYYPGGMFGAPSPLAETFGNPLFGMIMIPAWILPLLIGEDWRYPPTSAMWFHSFDPAENGLSRAQYDTAPVGYEDFEHEWRSNDTDIEDFTLGGTLVPGDFGEGIGITVQYEGFESFEGEFQFAVYPVTDVVETMVPIGLITPTGFTFRSTGALPAGLAKDRMYYIHTWVTPTTFNVCDVVGGGITDIGDVGIGTHYLQPNGTWFWYTELTP